MAARRSLMRRRSLHLVIVLMVFYPFGVYVYTRSVNRATAEDIVLRNIDAGLNYCFEVKVTLEELLVRPPDVPPSEYDPLAWLAAEADEHDFARKLERLLYKGGVTETLIRFTRVYQGEKRLLHWGQNPPERFVDEVEVRYPIDRHAIRGQMLAATEGGTAAGICKISLPLNLGEGYAGRLVVGLVAPNIGTQLAALSERLSARALRMSLVGTSLLALLAAYIVYLNERTNQLELRLEEEKRLAYVGTIAAGMAHEIRNPLNSVKMNIQMIEDRLSQPGEAPGEYVVNKVARIHRETARLEESVNNFLAFARPKPLHREWADLNQAIEHVIEFLEPACQRACIRIVRDFSADLPQAYIDPEQLGQAMENLIRNAHQAIGENGIIEVYTGRQGGYFEIRVSDNGPGIPGEAQDKVFEIFFTTKEGGSGLGLTIVKQIVEAHGGELSFDTIEKRGTTFVIALPLDEEL